MTHMVTTIASIINPPTASLWVSSRRQALVHWPSSRGTTSGGASASKARLGDIVLTSAVPDSWVQVAVQHVGQQVEQHHHDRQEHQYAHHHCEVVAHDSL